MAYAFYKTKRGAMRYAREIMAKFPRAKAQPAAAGGFSHRFGWNVLVRHRGRASLAAKRPRNYVALGGSDVS